MIEVEKRAVIDKVVYEAIGGQILAKGGVDWGVNDTDSTFYIHDSWQLKVQHQVSKGTAKIAWKSGGVDGAASRREVELSLAPDDVDKANEVIVALSPEAKAYPTKQKRHDYVLDDIGIAVKHSNDWGYHVELDCVVSDASGVDDVLTRIAELAESLGLHLFTPEEEKAFVEKAIQQRA
jgi:adenylate cyclase class IV